MASQTATDTQAGPASEQAGQGGGGQPGPGPGDQRQEPVRVVEVEEARGPAEGDGGQEPGAGWRPRSPSSGRNWLAVTRKATR